MRNLEPAWRAEAYRIFFPLGYLMAFLGLGVWGIDILIPGMERGGGHGILMMQGFAFAFSLGVLLTELPKSLGDISPPPWIHLVLLPLLLLAMAAAAIARQSGLAQVLFLLALGGLAAHLMLTLILKRGPAHPDFVFAGAGVVLALLGALAWVLAEAGLRGPGYLRWAELSVYQGYFLLFAFSTFHWEEPRSREAGPRARRARANAAVSSILLLILAAEAFAETWFPGHETLALRTAHAGKAALVLWFIAARVPLTGTAYHGAARWSLYAVLAGFALTVWLPHRSVAVSHVVYVAGFCWLALARAATLTAFREALLLPGGPAGSLSLYGGLLALGAALRVGADLVPGGRPVLLPLAAAMVVLPLLLWGRRMAGRPRPPAP